MPSAGIEPSVATSEPQQNDALDLRPSGSARIFTSAVVNPSSAELTAVFGAI